MFDIEFDEANLLLIATAEGYWTPRDVARHSAEGLAQCRAVGARHGFFRMLARAHNFPVQSPEVGAAFGQFTFELVRVCPGPIAITVKSMLNKMQASRALPHERIKIFLDEDEARQWLMSVAPASTAG